MNYCLDCRAATNRFPGIGRYVSNLARAIAEQLSNGERLLLVANSSDGAPWKFPPVSPQVAHVTTGATPFSFFQQWQLPRLLTQLECGLYHSPYYLMPYYTRMQTVVTVHDLIPQLLPKSVSRQARLLFGLATRLALRSADHVITVSNSTRDNLLARYRLSPRQVTAIPHAADARFRPVPEEEVTSLRRTYELHRTYTLYVGINKPHKNLLSLLKAWRWLVDVSPYDSPLLVIAGSWDRRYQQPIESVGLLGLKENVRFLGPVKDQDLPALYAAADLFVFPSLYEGFGLPVIEAMACGTAVACSNRSSLPEVAGDAAVYFDPENIEQMGKKIKLLLEDEHLRKEMARRGLDRASQFSWEQTAAKTLAIYRELA